MRRAFLRGGAAPQTAIALQALYYQALRAMGITERVISRTTLAAPMKKNSLNQEEIR